MRRSILILVGCLLLVGAMVMASDPGPWFDLKNCEFCNKLAAQPGLIEHMNHEYHMLHNGMMSITHIDKEFQPAFTKVQEAMRPVVVNLQAGKQVTTCRHCSTLGSLYMGGVMPDDIKTGDNIIVVYTSNDTTMVKKIQEFGKNSAEALAAMAAEKKDAAK